ncbi:MAG TPA: SH3 domain-containing protein [Dehalococcoidia bacterium]
MTRRTTGSGGRRACAAALLGLLALLAACSPGSTAEPPATTATPTPPEAGRQGVLDRDGVGRPEAPDGGLAVTSPTPSPSATPTPATPTPGPGATSTPAAQAAAASATPGAATPTPTPSPTPVPVTALPSINAYLHDGPDTHATVVGNLLAGERVTVLAISRDGLWLYVTGPSIGEDRGWVYINLVTVEGDVKTLPVREAAEREGR